MTNATELLGISNAIVDILTHVEDRFLEDIGAPRGSMVLIDAEQADALYERMGPTTEMSGGSVGNSVAGFAVLGGKAAYIGRVADDQFGAVFDHDMRSLGIDMRLPPETREAPTARSHVLISPDGQRTMQTYLGACGEIAVSDITDESVGAPGLVLIEGYIFDTPEGPASVEKAMSLALAKGARIALSLSDAMCVDRHLGEFKDLVGRQVRVVVGNDDEFKALFGVETYEEMIVAAKASNALCAITRSELGSVIVDSDSAIEVPAEKVEQVIDTTGAGDAFCAGFLFGLARNHGLADSARLGSQCAAQVIAQVGARLQSKPA